MDSNSSDEAAFPEFPTVLQEPRVRITRSHQQMTWAGTPSRLIAIQREVEQALKRAYEDQIARRRGDDATDWPASEEAIADAKQLGESLRLWVLTTGNDGNLKRYGDLKHVLDEMDLGDVQRVRMSNEPVPAYKGIAPEISLEFGRPKSDSAYSHGVQLSVTASDRQWAGGVIDTLSSSLRKGAPWWSFLRHWTASIIFVVALVNALLLLFMPTYEDLSLGEALTRFGLVAFMAALVGTIAMAYPVAKLLPSFEVYEQGGQPLGGRSLAAAVGVILFVLAVVGAVPPMADLVR